MKFKTCKVGNVLKPFGSLDFQTLLVFGPLQKLLLPFIFRGSVPLKSRKFKNSNDVFLVPLVLVDSIVCTYFPLFCIIYGLLDMQSMRVLWYLFYTLAYFLRILLFKNAHSSTLFRTFVPKLL